MKCSRLSRKGLQDVCRKSDYVARMGGDEFVMVIPRLREDLRWSYVERLQGVAHAAGWTVCSEQCISMSVGTAIYPGGRLRCRRAAGRGRPQNVHA